MNFCVCSCEGRHCLNRSTAAVKTKISLVKTVIVFALWAHGDLRFPVAILKVHLPIIRRRKS